MTSSPEASFREGKSNLKNIGDKVPYTAVDGYSGSRKAVSTRATFLFPSSYTWIDHKTLLKEIRSSFHSVEAGLRENFTATPSPAEASKTFLHTMVRFIQSGQANVISGYVYNGKSYKLTLARVKDRKQGTHFVAKGIASSPDTIDLLTGQIEEDTTKWRSQFKLWVDSSSRTPLPLRFEYAPKSFLKLAFEAEPNGKSQSKEIL
ncbi:MAG: hypothetical protein H7039_22735, partial [Bryobacteraceae bacterium]|nr:hypothetical protein [Bryobacteraceae bacterium]